MKRNELIAMLIVLLGVVAYYQFREPQWQGSSASYFEEEEIKTTGVVQSVEEKSVGDRVQTAKVRLEDGSLVSATILPNCLVAAGDAVSVSVLGEVGGPSYVAYPSQEAYRLSDSEFVE